MRARTLLWPPAVRWLGYYKAWIVGLSLLVIAILAGIGIIAVVTLGGDVQVAVLRRVTSTDGSLEAILFTTDVNATTETGYHVAIAPAASHTLGDEVYVSFGVTDENLFKFNWVRDSVEVQVPQASYVKVMKPNIIVRGRLVAIRFTEVPSHSDSERSVH